MVDRAPHSPSLTLRASRKRKEDFSGYDMYDLIVDKFDVRSASSRRRQFLFTLL